MATPLYGIRQIVFDKVVPGAFPDFDVTGETAFRISAIVKDSFSFNDTTAGENNIEIEDSDEYFAVLNSENASEGFSFDSYDLSEEMYFKLFGFEQGEGTNEGYIVNNPEYDSATLEFAVQVTTKKLGTHPAKIYEWARMKTKITKTGTLGKSGFPNIHIEVVELANFDGLGKEQVSHRIKQA